MELPKNIRQIGENDTNTHIYIEDYVITYLQQLEEEIEFGSKSVLLLGHAERSENENFFYVSGAIASLKKRIEEKSFIFDPSDKEYLRNEIKAHFPELHIIGWAVIESEFNKINEESVWCDSKDEFGMEYKIFCKISGESREKRWYLNSNGIVTNIPGYAIFYDQNEIMQNYLIRWHKEKKRVTENSSDHAAKQFREIIMQHQDRFYVRNAIPFFYMTCILLMLVVSAIGITTINRYDKMIAVENSMVELAQAMRENESLDYQGYETESAPHMEMEMNAKEQANITATTEGEKEGSTDVLSFAEVETEGQEEAPATTEAEAKMEDYTEILPATEAETEAREDPMPNTEIREDSMPVTEAEPEEQEIAVPVFQQQEVYYVQEGDTLAEISYRHYHTTRRVQDICQLNQIQDPDNIITGEKILLP
ncbi:MAG: LysM peptidoglycan-binding domain-containing protein [Lachnospiraceae bacterium]|nr:LysM peptidoglycan-binding domain-containing protein [Lachnospiraceae bacterium]